MILQGSFLLAAVIAFEVVNRRTPRPPSRACGRATAGAARAGGGLTVMASRPRMSRGCWPRRAVARNVDDR